MKIMIGYSEALMEYLRKKGRLAPAYVSMGFIPPTLEHDLCFTWQTVHSVEYFEGVFDVCKGTLKHRSWGQPWWDMSDEDYDDARQNVYCSAQVEQDWAILRDCEGFGLPDPLDVLYRTCRERFEWEWSDCYGLGCAI